MAFIIGKIRCCFCEGKMGVLYSVHAYGMYSNDVGKRIFYHPECLELVEMYPEKHGHRMMDLAIEISDRKKDNEDRTNSTIINKFNKKVEQLRRNSFERMMPKKT